MRIKSDYVTNSSSTNYVVCLPQNAKWVVSNLPEADYEEEVNNGEMEDNLTLTIQKLLNGDILWQEELGEWFYSIIDLCKKENLIIRQMDAPGGDGYGQIININPDDINRMSEILRRKCEF